YEAYLKTIHPDWSLATRKTTVSRAFYLYSHAIVPSFWAVLESQESLLQAKERLRQHFKALYSNQTISAKLSACFCALTGLKDYMDSQGGVKKVIGLEYQAQDVLYQQAKLVYEERILMESEAALLTHEEEKALPEGAIQLLKESLPFLEEKELQQFVHWFLALMNHTPFFLDSLKRQKPFYGVLLFFLERIEEEYGRERFVQALWTLQESIHQSYVKFHQDPKNLRLTLAQYASRYEISMRFDEAILKADFQNDFPFFLTPSLPSFKTSLSSLSSALFLPKTDFSLAPNLDSVSSLDQEESSKNHQEEEHKVSSQPSLYTQEDFEAEVFLSAKQSQILASLLKRKKNLILQGPPGTGKTYLAKRLAYWMLQEKNEDLICSVQFHANYTYEDFIMGYRPTKTGFALRPGVFYTFCQKARQDPRAHFFIIDEINRAPLAKIFGELFSLLESDKRGQSLPLLYTKEPFSIPDNVYVIGMMNTADRAISTMDYALRRRFAFFTMEPAFSSQGFQAYQKKANNPQLDRLVQEVESLNEEIREDETLGAGFQIGHSYLMNDKVDEAFLEGVVNFELLALLQEYWLDEPERVERWRKRLKQAIA
ncbi:MAG: AAA family ATPase, partial [Allobaculum sp.]|nr:AAA family ATPase [Allobaculum sp.]